VPAAEQDRAIATIVLAFASDPITRWIYPDAHQYLTYFPRIVKGFAGPSTAEGSAYQADDFAATALWLPPGVGPDEEQMDTGADESIPESQKEDLYAFGEKQLSSHPHEPHWYLPMIGVNPAMQGRGYGSALLKHTLAICDRQSLPAYLEATSIRSRALYQAHGFEVIDEVQAGKSPTLWPMLRRPR
jgi:GNAT superfamily N-acetyltransferase